MKCHVNFHAYDAFKILVIKFYLVAFILSSFFGLVILEMTKI